eukprot:3667977-Prymnesium_polylepis.1
MASEEATDATTSVVPNRHFGSVPTTNPGNARGAGVEPRESRRGAGASPLSHHHSRTPPRPRAPAPVQSIG